MDKLTIRSGHLFIVGCNHEGDGHVRGTGESANIATRKHAEGTCTPAPVPFTFSNTDESVEEGLRGPVGTARTAGSQVLAAASIIQHCIEQMGNIRADGLRVPLPMVGTSNRYGLVTARFVEYLGDGQPTDARKPVYTVTSHDREAIVCAHICKYYGGAAGTET